MSTSATTPSAAANNGLSELERRVRTDLSYLCYPPANWVSETKHRGETIHDVVIIGAGMCGLAASFALIAGGIRSVCVLDRSPRGYEGPWVTYARMETLRSPKHLTGPARGMASLTFRAWYVAQYGDAAWEALGHIPTPMWMDYLRWYRQVLALPVANDIAVERIVPQQRLMCLELAGAGTTEKTMLTRKVVMATGRDGTGRANIPSFVNTLPDNCWAHSSDSIDFKALAGKRVVVVGVGASAVDNAAEALEAGAAEVRHYIRRKEMPRINKLMGIGSFGFSAGFPELSDAWRWRYMHYASLEQTPAPHLSTLRVSRHENAFFHFDTAIVATEMHNNEIVITTTNGRTSRTDFLILGTGFTVDPLARSELDGYADKIMLWEDRYTPPPDLEHDELAKFPYLGKDFAFLERTPGEAPWLKNIYCFNFGATLSLGKISGDIPAVSEGANWLAREIAATLYGEDIEHHWQRLVDYDKPELLGDEWSPSELKDEPKTLNANAKKVAP